MKPHFIFLHDKIAYNKFTASIYCQPLPRPLLPFTVRHIDFPIDLEKNKKRLKSEAAIKEYTPLHTHKKILFEYSGCLSSLQTMLEILVAM